ncbi:hypothetical protein [Nitrosomonas sp.]|uniref:hypothetical protein n=1 Tax=Nitrosomonas sp. TaxID=42353 RepID=UPI00283DC33D|nr:hypothetical protein [Nitrosomonas sp.]MDR4513639.1 hypothetical protein [Nitrosomonas sp.]
MSESHVLSGLVAKRSELSGLIHHYQSEIDRISGDLRHIDASIKIFSPEFDLRTVRPKEHRKRNIYFKNGECQRLILDILRDSASELTSRAIAESIAKIKRIDPETEIIEQFRRNALGALKKLEKKGLVIRHDSDGMASAWELG